MKKIMVTVLSLASLLISPARAFALFYVLDVGCGLGAFARRLTPHARQVLGVDISDEAVSEASRMSRGLPNVHYVQADICDFLAPSHAFDLIVLADVLYYMAPINDRMLKLLIEKIAQSLSPGGLLLLTNHYFFNTDRASRNTSLIHDLFRRSPWLIRMTEYARAFYLATLMKRIEEVPPFKFGRVDIKAVRAGDATGPRMQCPRRETPMHRIGSYRAAAEEMHNGYPSEFCRRSLERSV